MATETAQAFGIPVATIQAATARAFLATARGDLEGVTDAVAAVRATGIAQGGLISLDDWRCLEIAALIGRGQLGQAETALTELEAALAPAGPPSARMAAARLRGDLAVAAGQQAAAAEAFQTAWRRAKGLPEPLDLAQLEISDARRLRAADQPQAAVDALVGGRCGGACAGRAGRSRRSPGAAAAIPITWRRPGSYTSWAGLNPRFSIGCPVTDSRARA